MYKIVIILVALIGAGLFGYPTAADHLAQRNGSYAIEDYAEAVSGYSKEELDAAWAEAVEYNENLSGYPAHDPFLDGSGMVMPNNYFSVLSIDDTMGYITIPRIGVELPIRHGTASATLAKGAGHLEGSSMPVGGPSTHCAITGHTGLSSARLFTDLVELEEGDMFYLHVLGRTLAYRVDQISVVEPEDTSLLKRVQDEDYCTLVTCTPYGVNSHRLLVRGARVPYTEGQETAAAGATAGGGLTAEQKLQLTIGGGTAVLMFCGILLAAAIRRRLLRSYT
ncbi:MAG: class C sortase [Clostridiales Family XIII bacterium]|jgi:sortase A|nr:class C sortase [Clostridiales Family XIII bacterium]